MAEDEDLGDENVDIDDLEESVERHRTGGRLHEAAVDLYTLGNAYLANARFVQADTSYEQAQVIYTGLDLVEDCADCDVGRGNVLSQQGKASEALSFYRTAEHAYGKAESDIGIAHSTFSMANAYVELGRLQEAVDAFVRSRTAYLKEDMFVEAADCTYGLGNAYFGFGRYRTALACYGSVLEFYRGQNQPDTQSEGVVADCLFSSGNVQLKANKFDEAGSLYRQARTIYTALGSPLDVSNCTYNLGNVALAEERFDDAQRDFTDSLRTARRTGNTVHAAECLHALGNVHKRNSVHGEAIRCYSRAKMVFLQQEMPAMAARSDLCIAQVLADRAQDDRTEPVRSKALLRLATRRAVPAMLFLDSGRFQFRSAADRRGWTRTVEDWMQWLFEVAVELDDRVLVADLVEWSVNVGIHQSRGYEPEQENGRAPSSENPAPQSNRDGQTRQPDMGGAIRLLAGQHLPMSPPPRLQMPDLREALFPHIDRADRRYRPIVRPHGPIRTW